MADEIPVTLFEQLYRRAPSDAERRRLLDVKAALGLSAHDELWPVIMTLDHYAAATAMAGREIIKEVRGLPGKLKAAVAGAEDAAAAKADLAVARAVERGAELLTQIVVQRTQTTNDNISRRQIVTAGWIGALIAVACLGAGVAGGYYLRSDRGMASCTGAPFILIDDVVFCRVNKAIIG